MPMTMLDLLIVGAGLSGLNLARELRATYPALAIQILEKSRGCGGRMATRRVDDSKFDHGAQFIKSSRTSQNLIHFWQQENVLRKFPTDSFEAYCGQAGMTDLAKKLAAPFHVSYNLKVKMLEKQADHWHVLLEEGVPLQARHVVLTCPLPQALEILSHSDISSPAGLSEIKYQKAIVLLVQFASALAAENDYAENFDKNIFSICSQQAKGLAKRPDYTIVMQEGWTEAHFDRPDEDIAREAHSVLSQTFPNQNVMSLQVKKWRYSQPTQIWNQPFENPAPGLYLAGDAFGGASLNGALKSSTSLAEHLRSVFATPGARP